ncbi:MAG: ABC transporter substrate-binding protein [Propioniciclava sp.]
MRHTPSVGNTHLSRRRLLQLGAAATAGATLSACTAPSSDAINLQLVHGATGGGLKDTLDPHFPVTWPDIARVRQLYEPLLRYNKDFEVELSLAESVEHNADATEWTFRLRPGLLFHHGRPVTAQDVRASFERMLNPDNPAPYLADVAPIADLDGSQILDDRTYRLKLQSPYAIFDLVIASYSLGIIPEDFDPAQPVGTGPWMFDQFVPGQRSRFLRFDDYWDIPASFEELVIIDFNDDAAKVNAVLSGQIHTLDNLPSYLAGAIENQGAKTLVSETGGWVPFTMRIDAEPFSDVRVRQAMRLLVDRDEMISQALNGFGRVANDLYSPFDPAYIGDDRPQRTQDIDQAKSLLRSAGQEGLQVELVTSSGVGVGAVESANLFVQHAKAAGVDVRLNKVDSSIFYGDQYLSWVFAQDFWSTRLYLPQASACALKTSPYNETHWYDERYASLIQSAQQETDPARRNTLLEDAQQLEYDEGGYIIWAFKNQVDAYSQFVTGLEPAREQPVSAFRFNLVKPVTQS